MFMCGNIQRCFFCFHYYTKLDLCETQQTNNQSSVIHEYPQCINCHVFLSSSTSSHFPDKTVTVAISGAHKKRFDGFIVFSEFSLACLQTLLLTYPRTFKCNGVCSWILVFYVYKSVRFSQNALVLLSLFFFVCVCQHGAVTSSLLIWERDRDKALV